MAVLEEKLYLFAGDSLTEGTYGESYVARVSQALERGERGLPGRIVNAGRRHDTVQALLNRIEGPFKKHRPDWLVLAVGGNDVWLSWLAAHSLGWWGWLHYRQLRWGQQPTQDLDRFAAAYRALIDKGRQSGARVLACTASPIGERLSSPVNRQLARLNGVIKHVAAAQQVPIADVWQVFVQVYASLEKASGYLPGEWLFAWLDRRRLNTSTPDEIAERRRLRLTFDGLHLNSRGADLWASTILDALVRAQTTDAFWAPAVFRQLGLPCFDLGPLHICHSPGWESRARDIGQFLALAYGRMASLTGAQPRICLAVLNPVHWQQAGGPEAHPKPAAHWEDHQGTVFVPDAYDAAFLHRAHLPEVVSSWDAWPEPWCALGQPAQATAVADLLAVRELAFLFLWDTQSRSYGYVPAVVPGLVPDSGRAPYFARGGLFRAVWGVGLLGPGAGRGESRRGAGAHAGASPLPQAWRQPGGLFCRSCIWTDTAGSGRPSGRDAAPGRGRVRLLPDASLCASRRLLNA